MLENYLPVLLFVLVGLGFGVVPFALGRLLGPHKPDPEKLSAYECGFPAFEDARMKFDVRYYLIAILFILFDLEIAFLFPWATVFREISPGASLVRVWRGDGVSGHSCHWLHCRMEEWCARLGMR